MTDTSNDTTAGPAGAGDAGVGTGAPVDVPVDVRSLDDQSVLDAMATARRAADRQEAALLRFAVHYVDLHPVTQEHPAATPGGGDRRFQVEDDTSDPATGDPAAGDPVGLEGLGGPGTPGVGAYAVEALGGHLCLSYLAAYGLVSDAVELCYRLPRLWELVQAGRLQAWKARQVTAHTRSVSVEAAGFVDRHLARDASRNRVPSLSRLRELTHEALLQCDPETAQGREEAALTARDVTFDHRDAASTGSSRMSATLDTVDALDLHHTIAELATTMGRLGDTSPLGVRRAHALGMLARPDRALDLFGDHPADQPTDQPTDPPTDQSADPSSAGPEHANGGDPDDDGCGDPGDQGAGGQRGGTLSPVFGNPFNRTTATLFVHIDADDLDTGTGTGGTGVGSVEKLGAATLDLIRGWLQRTSHVTIRPVLHQRDGHAETGHPQTGHPQTGTVTHPWTHRTTSPGTSTSSSGCSSSGPGADEDAGHADACCTPVDRHDPPAGMREAVILRDGHCVFPACTVDARSCDVDHIVAYLDPDNGGPPGQTGPGNLACLCRRHHRLKTFTAWDYGRLPDGDYQWTSPAGRVYLAAPTPKTAPHLR